MQMYCIGTRTFFSYENVKLFYLVFAVVELNTIFSYIVHIIPSKPQCQAVYPILPKFTQFWFSWHKYKINHITCCVLQSLRIKLCSYLPVRILP